MKFCFLALLFPITASAFMENQFLSLADAEKMWGTAQFDSKAFKAGDGKARATMTVDLIRSGRFVGEKLSNISKSLGPSDGRYNTSREPAYLLGDDGKNFLQLVFLPDSGGRVVEEVKIHKRCCVSEGPSVATDPTDVQVTKATSGLLVHVRGGAAQSIFEGMTKIPAIKGVKTGDSMSCGKVTTTAAPVYNCEFTVNPVGTVRTREF